MLVQLNPMIPMITPKGKGYAVAMIDYSQEHSLIWIVALDSDGQIWSFQNEEVKLQWNRTMRRSKEGAACPNNLVIMGDMTT